MFDHYLEFSEEIECLTDEEKTWLRMALNPPAEKFDNTGTGFSHEFIDWMCDCGFTENMEVCEWEYFPDFDHTFKEEGKRHSLYIYSVRQYGKVDDVAVLIQVFLAKFRPLEVWSFRYCGHGDGLDNNDCYGGGFAASAKEVRWITPDDILKLAQTLHEDILKEHQERSTG